MPSTTPDEFTKRDKGLRRRRYRGETEAERRSLPAYIKMPDVPPLPADTDDAEAMQRELDASKIEYVMLRGVSNVYRIRDMTGLSIQRIRKLQEQVHARWSVIGRSGSGNRSEVIGKCLAKFEMLEREAWAIVKLTDKDAKVSNKDKLSALALIERLVTQSARLHGVNMAEANTLNAIVNTGNKGSASPNGRIIDGSTGALEQINEHSALREIAQQFLELMAEGAE